MVSGKHVQMGKYKQGVVSDSTQLLMIGMKQAAYSPTLHVDLVVHLMKHIHNLPIFTPAHLPCLLCLPCSTRPAT